MVSGFYAQIPCACSRCIWSCTVHFQSTLHILWPTHINNENDNINFVLIHTVQERCDSWSEFGDVWQHWHWCTTSSANSDWVELQPDCHIHAPAKESTEIISETCLFFSTFKFATLKLLALASNKESCHMQTVFIKWNMLQGCGSKI